LKLFGRLTSHVVNEPTLWKLYAQLVTGCSNDFLSDLSTELDPETSFKAAQHMQKAIGVAVQKKDWFKGKDNCNEIMNLASNAAVCK